MLPPHEPSTPPLMLPSQEPAAAPAATPTPAPAAKWPPPATSEEHERLLRIVEDITAESWRVATLLVRTLAAALLPVRFRELPHVIAAYLGHIAHRHEKKRATAIATFLKRVMVATRAGSDGGAAAEDGA